MEKENIPSYFTINFSYKL